MSSVKKHINRTRATALILILAMLLLCLYGCAKKQKDNVDSPTTVASDLPITEETPETKKTTLMIYMVGSDLESNSAAATEDLEEIAQSGIDLSLNNLVVFTGGSPIWYTDIVSDDAHYTLELSEEGFSTVSSVEDSSMGETDTLTYFLNQAYTDYPAEEYALIMWDHGTGPVEGYGKDILYDGDHLTLKEMQGAFANSPFTSENKLAWIGFDACLMASAELAVICSEYADYLIASQEKEPNFGWDYSFLSDLNTDTHTLFDILGDKYYNSCIEYFEKKNYSDRHTTLSCFDLSKADNLKVSIEALFGKAEEDIQHNYNALVSKRVETRSPGRSSGKSDYDLIDLRDLATRISDMYPDEATAVIKAIDEIIISNYSNSESLCGVSLYYPFTNQAYFEDKWWDIYHDLAVFPEYLNYLTEYCEIWLGNDFLEKYAGSTMPKMIDNQTFSLSLTPEQSETFADAYFWILEKEGDALYTPVYVSSNVQKEGNTLTTTFDGNVIYAKDKFNNLILPTTVEYDNYGDTSKYKVTAAADNGVYFNEEIPNLFISFKYDLAVNNETKEISVSSMIPITSNEDELESGKYKDVDLTDYNLLNFPLISSAYMKKYDNGTIAPVEEWEETGSIFYKQIPIDDFVGFTFAPLNKYEYYLIFEVVDTQGNKYCSELLEIESTIDVPEEIKPENIYLDWSEGESFKLGNFGGVDLGIVIKEYEGKSRYFFTMTNNNDFSVNPNIQIPYINGNIYCHNSKARLSVNQLSPGESAVSQAPIHFGSAEDIGDIEKLLSMQLQLYITNSESYSKLVNGQIITLDLPEDKVSIGNSSVKYDKLRLNLHATKQEIYNADGVAITLIGMGDNKDRKLAVAFKIENNTTLIKNIEVNRICFDDISIPLSIKINSIGAGCTVYAKAEINADKLDTYNLYYANKLRFHVEVYNMATYKLLEHEEWCDAALNEPGEAAIFPEGDTVIHDENGVKIAIIAHYQDKNNHRWFVSVVNDSDKGYSIESFDIMLNGEPVTYGISFGAYESTVYRHEKTVFEISAYTEEYISDISCRLRFFDSEYGKIMYESQEAIEFIKNGTPLT